MKKILLIAMAVTAITVSCKRETKTPDGNGHNPGTQDGGVALQLWARSPEGLVWSEGDAIGLYSSDDFNARFEVDYLEEGKEDRARFAGKISDDAQVFGAYYPYDSDAGEKFDALRVSIPEEVKHGDAPAVFALAPYDGEASIALSFTSKLAVLKVVFSDVAGSAVEGLELQDITITGQRNMVGLYAANLIQPSQMLAALNGSDVLVFDMKGETLTEGLEASASIAATWKGGDRVGISINGGEFSTEAVIANAVEEGSEVALQVNASVFNPKITLDWVSPALGIEEGYATSEIRSNYPAVDNSGNVYVQISRGAPKLYKLSPEDGSVLWAADLGYTPDNNTSPSCEADGSVVYALGGSSGSGRVKAINGTDGSIKWEFLPEKFFGNGSTPAPNFNQVAPAIGPDCIYVGNAGTTGTVLAIDKNTGVRKAYVSGAANGTGGPAGGAMSGVSITAGGEVAWFANYGIFTADMAKLDAPALSHATYGAYVPWAQRFWHGWSYNSSRSGVACSKVDGVDAVWALGIEKASSGAYHMHVLCAKVSSGKELNENNKAFFLDKKIENITNQDQGGIVIGPRGEAIVALKGTPGSIKGVMPDGSIAYSYSLPGGKDVTGACAVDNNGYIHIVGDNSGRSDYYAIVKPDYGGGNCEEVAVSDLNALLKDSGADLGTAEYIRAWTSVVLGNDGKIYLGVTARNDEGSTMQARVLRLSYKETTGPSAVSPWPQRGADAAHSGNQK